ncbi:junctional adhesion molecule A-like [Aquarana catesbeiana]|uniref:junctional adhesion molecule A-like n=1 Tax=Aquarana catesbeiana TaxID=8400 RepID=UPI003CC9F5FA
MMYYDGELTTPYKSRATFFPQGLRLDSVTRKDSGEYSCEVTGKDSSGKPQYFQDKTQLVVLVPPSVPIAQVPTSVSTGSTATLYCIEKDASPPPVFTWYKNGVPMPENPKDSPTFQNSSYTIDKTTGQLQISPVMKTDVGQYSCQAENPQGKESSAPVQMEVSKRVLTQKHNIQGGKGHRDIARCQEFFNGICLEQRCLRKLSPCHMPKLKTSKPHPSGQLKFSHYFRNRE